MSEEIQLISLNDDREVVRARVRWFFHLAKSGRWVARVTMNPDPLTPHVSESVNPVNQVKLVNTGKLFGSGKLVNL